jgi:hypothetical protein
LQNNVRILPAGQLQQAGKNGSGSEERRKPEAEDPAFFEWYPAEIKLLKTCLIYIMFRLAGSITAGAQRRSDFTEP